MTTEDILKRLADGNARFVADLTGKSEIIKNAVENADVKIVSAYYNLVSGKVDFY